MANLYVRSTDGSDADNGSTWALAKATIGGAAAIDAAGDTIFVSQSHAESLGSGSHSEINMAGTVASPSKIICGNDGAEPPTAVAASAIVETSGAGSIRFSGNFYCYGLTCKAGLYTSLQYTGAGVQVFENCSFEQKTGASYLSTGWGGNYGHVKWIDCDFKANGNSLFILVEGSFFEWRGGALLAGTGPSPLIATYLKARAIVSGVDLSGGPSTMNLVGIYSGMAHHIIFADCKLPTSWTGSLFSGTMTPGTRVEMYNCDSGDTNYRLWIEDYAGSIKHETTIVRTGGASDGTTTLSWKMASSANAEYPTIRLESQEIVRWNETTGSAITVTVETVTDNVTLTDAECWLEVQYLGTSGAPLATLITDAKADVLASAANQATSTETWTTTGLATPVKQKLAVTFTPQEKGFIRARVVLCKASTTVYVDPELTVT